MRRLQALIIAVLVLTAVAPARAGDYDLLRTKVVLSLALLIDAVAQEDPSTPNHAERIASVRAIRDNLNQYASRLVPRVLRSYSTSADTCAADTLNPAEVHCWNLVPQATVDNQVIALWGTDLSALSAAVGPGGDQLAALQAAVAEIRAREAGTVGRGGA